jgi:hypothetical protein
MNNKQIIITFKYDVHSWWIWIERTPNLLVRKETDYFMFYYNPRANDAMRGSGHDPEQGY